MIQFTNKRMMIKNHNDKIKKQGVFGTNKSEDS